MKYEKCLTCDQLGTNCDGPNLLSMDTVELGLWCNELRKDSYDKIAAETELSKSAVRDFCTGKHEDCSMRTARTIAKYVTNGKWDDNPCGNLTNEERAAYEDALHKNDVKIEWYEDKIQHLTEEIEYLKTVNKTVQKVARQRRIELIVVSIGLAVTLALVITAFVLDAIDPSKGFFWLGKH